MEVLSLQNSFIPCVQERGKLSTNPTQMDYFPWRPTLLSEMLLNTLCFCAFQAVFPFSSCPIQDNETLKFVLNYDLKLLSESRSLNLPRGYFLLWKQQREVFRGGERGLWFCLGENNMSELSGNHKEYQGFELSYGVSIWKTSLQLTSSCFSHVMGSARLSAVV